jgi:hypothetical protein
VKNKIQDKIQNWLIDKFLNKAKASRATATTILWLVSVDIVWIVKAILSRYGLKYLFKYILFIAMI